MYSPAPHPAAKAYQQLDTQSRIEDASPHRLIQLMMERALAKIGLAGTQMRERQDCREG